jgi:hypothetical protein
MAQRRKKLSADGIAAAAPHAAPKYDMVSRRVLSLNARFPLLVLSAWLVLYAARPFYLGIYQDDWWALIEPVHATAPFSLDRLSYFVGLTTNYGPRPVLGFTAFIVTSLMGKSVFGLQCASIFLVLAAALSPLVAYPSFGSLTKIHSSSGPRRDLLARSAVDARDYSLADGVP